MKLADVCEFYSEQGGGVRTYCHQKLQAARTHGVEAIIIAPGAEDRVEERLGGRIYWVKTIQQPGDPRYHLFTRSVGVHAILDAERPQVVEGSSTWQGGRIAGQWQGGAVKSLFLHQDPVAVYLHTFFDHMLDRATLDKSVGFFWSYLKRLNARFDTTIVSGQWLADRLMGFGLRDVTAIPFGICKDSFSPDLRDEGIRRRMLAECGIDNPDAQLLITVSRHHPEKRLSTLVEAVDRVNKDRPVGLYLVGDGPFRQSVEKKAAASKGVHVAGYLSDRATLAQYLASADAMLHGSAAETYGLVLAEGLCAGLPLIVPDQGGAEDLAHPAYAETYRAGDVAACVSAITAMLARDRWQTSAAASAIGKTRIRTPDAHFTALFNHYQRLINDRMPVLAAAE